MYYNMNLVSSSFVPDVVIPSQKAIRPPDQTGLALAEAVLAVSNQHLSFVYVSMASRRICSMILPDTEMGLTNQQFPGSSFLHTLKMDTMFSFFQSLWISHDFSNVMESGLATTSVSSIRTTYHDRCDERWSLKSQCQELIWSTACAHLQTKTIPSLNQDKQTRPGCMVL